MGRKNGDLIKSSLYIRFHYPYELQVDHLVTGYFRIFNTLLTLKGEPLAMTSTDSSQ